MATYQILLRNVDFIINENGIVDKRLLKKAFDNRIVFDNKRQSPTNAIQIQAKQSEIMITYNKDILYNDLISFYNGFISNCVRLAHELDTPFITVDVFSVDGKLSAFYRSHR